MMSDDDARDALGRYVSPFADPTLSSFNYAESWLEDTDAHVLGGSRLPADWRFLYRRFALLEHRVVVAELRRLDTHEVRIGRKPLDWWLEVKLGADAGTEWDALADNRVQRFRRLREAVVLLSIFAQVDYASWIAELVRTAKFTPRKAMDLEMHKLSCQWAFDFNPIDFSVHICQWTMLRDLLGFKTLSKEFKRDLARAMALARAQGITVEPVAVQLSFNPSPAENIASHIKAVRGLTEVVTELLALDAAYATQQQDPSFMGPPVFRVERLIADFKSVALNPPLLAEIQRFLETGIPVHTLYLPGRSLDREMDAAEYLPAWGRSC